MLMDEASVTKYELSQTHRKSSERNPFKITNTQIHSHFSPTCNSVQAQKAKFSPVPSCLLLHLGSLSSRVDEDTSFPPKKKDMSIISGDQNELTRCMSAQAKLITDLLGDRISKGAGIYCQGFKNLTESLFARSAAILF